VKSGVIEVQLTPEERDLLIHGLGEWGGPTRPTEALAPAMGFDSVEELLRGTERIAAALKRGEALSPEDWARAQIATEIAFASDYYGSGWDWSITQGHEDEATIRCLRDIQRKLITVARLP
jgi:hypothetical protein